VTFSTPTIRGLYRGSEIVVVDRDDAHVYQPGLLFVPFGLAEARRLTRPRWRHLRSGISYCQARGKNRPAAPADPGRIPIRRYRSRQGPEHRPAVLISPW
jgi:hypothetical protein